jgi:hypothetical protein
MTRAGNKRADAAPSRRPLWRRLNRHVVFVLHVLLYLVAGTWIWTLNAPTLDKQFDVLLWLTALCAHGLAVYRNHRLAFLFHLLMFAAGNGAIFATTAQISEKLTVLLAWVFVVGLVGIWLARRHLGGRPRPAASQKRKPGAKKPAKPKLAPQPDTEWLDPPDDADSAGDTQETAAYSDDYGAYVPPPDDPTPPQKKRGRKKGSA